MVLIQVKGVEVRGERYWPLYRSAAAPAAAAATLHVQRRLGTLVGSTDPAPLQPSCYSASDRRMSLHHALAAAPMLNRQLPGPTDSPSWYQADPVA